MRIPAQSSPKLLLIGATAIACIIALGASSGDASGGNPGPGGSASSRATTSTAANQALQRSLAAAKSAGSVRITVHFFSGNTSGEVVQDSSNSSGKQTVAIGKELASTVLVHGTAYISGNEAGMTFYFGLPSVVTSTISGKWVSVQPSDAAFQSVAANVALPTALRNVTPTGTLTLGKSLKVKGRRVRSISGTSTDGLGRLTLFVAANSQSLPVEAIEATKSGKLVKGEIVTFSRWGEALHLPKPRGAVPLSVIEAASSASG
jgi:hypothetical protein